MSKRGCRGIRRSRNSTHRECIDLCIAYLEDYLLCESDAIVGLTEELEIEQKGAEKAECAFAIFGKILPAMWVG